MIHIMKKGPMQALDAFTLLDTRYQEEGYVAKHTGFLEETFFFWRFLVFYWKLLTIVSSLLVATDEEGHIQGMLSVSIFKKWRTPFGRSFKAQISSIQKSHNRLVYVGSFATSHDVSCTKTALRLISTIKKVSLNLNADACICIVNPKHVDVYKKFGFRTVAETSCMQGLRNAPGVLMLITKDDLGAARF